MIRNGGARSSIVLGKAQSEREGEMMETIVEEINECSPLPLLSLNHISLLCRSLGASTRFYEEVLGFVLIKRPASFNFDGAWLFNYGVGIHLLQKSSINTEDILRELRPINPKDNHISFQCTDPELVKMRLEEMGIKYETAVVEDGGIWVDQVFFHDPDGYMIEICNCENIPILPISSCPVWSKPSSSCKKASSGIGFTENAMMDRLSMEMINISF